MTEAPKTIWIGPDDHLPSGPWAGNVENGCHMFYIDNSKMFGSTYMTRYIRADIAN